MRIFILFFCLLFNTSPAHSAPMSEQAAQRARLNYLLNCVSCHLQDGSGSKAGHVPDLGEYLGLFAQHPEGRAFLVQVPGASGAPISDAELAEVTNWILYTMNKEQLRADFKPYTVEEVGIYRKSPILDVERTRAELVHKIVNSYSEK